MARICIDGFNLAMPTGSGIATYARNLRETIKSLGHEVQILFGSSQDLGPNAQIDHISLLDPEIRGAKAGLFTVRRWERMFWPCAHDVIIGDAVIPDTQETRFPPANRYFASRNIFHAANMMHRFTGRFTPVRLGRSHDTDIMHWTAPLPLFVPRIPNVYTLHDLIPLRLPQLTLHNKRAYYDMCKKIVRRADRIFTVSEHSRRDIIRLLGAREDQVVNTYQSVSIPEQLLNRTEPEIAREVEDCHGLDPQGYFLCFGSLDPKKNLARIVEAYSSSDVNAPLVIVGHAWRDRLAQERMRLGGVEMSIPHEQLLEKTDRIRVLDYLPFGSLVTLMQGARALLFPSLFEGFGLPVLEAMQLGTPVLASNEGAIPEIEGDAALLVDPYDVVAIRKGIQALDSNAGLRDALIEKGCKRAEFFSAERYRQRLQTAYQPLL
jgi:glycosyltransferase involved in cell wall biosynthesis